MQSDYTRLLIYPVSLPSLTHFHLKITSERGFSLTDTPLGPLFLVNSKGQILTPRLSTPTGQWTGVRPNIMRDSLLVVFRLEADSLDTRSGDSSEGCG